MKGIVKRGSGVWRLLSDRRCMSVLLPAPNFTQCLAILKNYRRGFIGH